MYINLKMSHKLDAPATLNVVSEGMSMQERSIEFAASKDQKRFALSLTLHADIDPDVRGRKGLGGGECGGGARGTAFHEGVGEGGGGGISCIAVVV